MKHKEVTTSVMEQKIKFWLQAKDNNNFYDIMRVFIGGNNDDNKSFSCNAMPILNHENRFKFANFAELGILTTVQDKKEFLLQLLSKLKSQHFDANNLYVEIYKKRILFEDYIKMIN